MVFYFYVAPLTFKKQPTLKPAMWDGTVLFLITCSTWDSGVTVPKSNVTAPKKKKKLTTEARILFF